MAFYFNCKKYLAARLLSTRFKHFFFILGAIYLIEPKVWAILPGEIDTSKSTTGKITWPNGNQASFVHLKRDQIITAGHNVGYPHEERYTSEGVADSIAPIHTRKHARYDIGIVQLEKDLGIDQPLYLGNQELGKEVKFTGYGASGYYENNSWQYDWSTIGPRRVGTNTVSDSNVFFLISDFDGDGVDTYLDGGPTINEAYFGPGDSGGGTFITENGIEKLAGIHVSISNSNPQFGERNIDVRLSAIHDWIMAFETGVSPIEDWHTLAGTESNWPNWIDHYGINGLQLDAYHMVRGCPPDQAICYNWYRQVQDPKIEMIFSSPFLKPDKANLDLSWKLKAKLSGAPVALVVEILNTQTWNWDSVSIPLTSKQTTASLHFDHPINQYINWVDQKITAHATWIFPRTTEAARSQILFNSIALRFEK